MNKEIGSEFWEADLCDTVHHVAEKAHRFLLSGRTALDFIIRDIKFSKGLGKVCMPSYCCHTMIQPFIDNNVAVEFYEINFENGRFTYDLSSANQCDTVLIMQYFGFCDEAVASSINKLKESGKTVIEDATHSWFSADRNDDNSDYIFASFRKWTGLPGGAVVIKKDGDFGIKTPIITNDKYISIRENAERLKKQYINDGIGGKAVFLELFRQAEDLLQEDYRDYCLPKTYEDKIAKLDYEKIRKDRKSNAVVLIEGIKEKGEIQVAQFKETDVPLFVPAIIVDGKRDGLRRHLIERGIYCPVHWPLSGLHNIRNKHLYDNSISLVCDQRYSPEDMLKLSYAVNDFFREV